MTLILVGAGAVAWICLFTVVLAACASATRGDRALAQQLAGSRPKAGARGPKLAAMPGTAANDAPYRLLTPNQPM